MLCGCWRSFAAKLTSPEVIATCMQLSKTLGKVGVLVGNCRGFVGQSYVWPLPREAQFLIEEGCEHRSRGPGAGRFWQRHWTASRGRPCRSRCRLAHQQGISPPATGPAFASIVEDHCVNSAVSAEIRSGLVQIWTTSARAAPDPVVDELIRKWVADGGNCATSNLR